ncbi:MAG: chemotaxis-specific protein-glutamate methyltransferase CheB [Spirochaetes bacterium]|nr:chemotaxis-specific protein-glutamate methyltransferase CheB [Spirochaetota bacterium]
MKKIRVFLVDDSISILKVLTTIFVSDPEIEICGWATNGKDAIDKIPQLKPDVVVTDIEMPEMGGIALIKFIERNHPLPVLVFSTYTYEGAKVTYEALEAGAIDFLCKPKSKADVDVLKDELVSKIKIINNVKIIRRVDIDKLKKEQNIDLPDEEEASTDSTIKHLIVIGASTGGPYTLEVLISSLPDNLTHPIVVALHMPPNFTKYFSEKLNLLTHYHVKEVEDGERILNSTIYIGQGGRNVKINSNSTFSIIKSEGDALPSVDILFESAGSVFRNKVVGIVLTGMGNDGLKGARRIKETGGKIIAESEESAVIYGMPKCIIDNNLADEIAHFAVIPQILSGYA